jgi:hypothetical protein
MTNSTKFNNILTIHRQLIGDKIDFELLGKLERLTVYILIIIIIVLILKLLSKLYGLIVELKLNKRKHGYYFNHKSFDSKWLFKIINFYNQFKIEFKSMINLLKTKLKTIKIVKKRANSEQIGENINFIIIDRGHSNRAFKDDSNISIISQNDNNKSDTLSLFSAFSFNFKAKKRKNKLFSHFKDYFSSKTKKENSFYYHPLIDDTNSNSNKLSSLIQILKSYFKNIIIKQKKNKTIPVMNNSTSIMSSLGTSCTSTSTFYSDKLPIILITDTSSLETSIFDLNTFDAEIPVYK